MYNTRQERALYQTNIEEDIKDMEKTQAYKQRRITKAKSLSICSVCERLQQESNDLKQKIQSYVEIASTRVKAKTCQVVNFKES